MNNYFFLKVYRDHNNNLKIDKIFCDEYYIQYPELYHALDDNSVESVYTFDIGENMHLIVDSEGRIKNLPITFESINMDKKIESIHQFHEPSEAVKHFINTDPDYFLAGPVLVVGHELKNGSLETTSLTEKMVEVFYNSIFSITDLGTDFLVLKNKQYR